MGDAGRKLPDGGQLLRNQELIAAALQSRTGVADVRHQVAKVIAHHPQFVFLGVLVGSVAIAAIQLRIGDHAAEWKEHSIEEEPKQKAAQEERQGAGNADHPGGSRACVGRAAPLCPPVDGDQLAAETAGFRGKAAVDLRQQDCLWPVRFAFLAKCDHFFSSRVEFGPRLFQSEQKAFSLLPKWTLYCGPS